ncbi:unnamed protein product [Cladocopium goreaui]|uniref:Tankyrase-1 n=1 Tax=Cladocopium goreaui TaxID=2562237 RepID=A0A9P1GI98_9DINO|nr:unnamed protein product [Cladocopium goreaui]
MAGDGDAMVEEERHFALLLDVGLCMATLVALGCVSFIVGGWVKPRAPKYWTRRTWNPFSDDYYAEVEVTSELRDIVQQLFDMTTQSENMGRGEDGKWASHKSFRVLQAGGETMGIWRCTVSRTGLSGPLMPGSESPSAAGRSEMK